MPLPGEEAAYATIYSPFADSLSKAEAAAKLRDIQEIREHNRESDRRWRERNDAWKAQQEMRKGICPTCGRGPE